MNQCNEDLRKVIKKIWKKTDPKFLDLIVPPPSNALV
jgi:voltage-dependent calcium channel L type alpha-1D